MLLGDIEIRRLIEECGLITDYIDLETQLQPTGFDLTIGKLEEFTGSGVMAFNNNDRVIAPTRPIESYTSLGPDLTTKSKYWRLKGKHVYKATFNETVNIRDVPYPISILSIYRGSMGRNGAETGIGVWDYGYTGKGYSLIKIENPYGMRLYENSRIHQLCFFKATEVSEKYSGQYLRENL